MLASLDDTNVQGSSGNTTWYGGALWGHTMLVLYGNPVASLFHLFETAVVTRGKGCGFPERD